MVAVTQRLTALAANTRSTELLQGSQLAFAPKDGTLSLYGTGSAAGIRATLIVGGETVLDDQDVSAANRFPVRDQDLVHVVGVRKGEQVRLFMRNDSGGSLNHAWIAELL